MSVQLAASAQPIQHIPRAARPERKVFFILHDHARDKGLIERIIVRNDGTAVEGNCRTVCYRKLRTKHPKDARWHTIPARVLPNDIGDRDIAILLGEMHVAGKNTWSPFEKAGHVYRLHHDFGLTQEEIAQRLRLSKSKVNQLIRAFDLMKTRFLPAYPKPSSIRKFSYFEEAFKNPALREWLTSTPGADGLMVQWVGEEKLTQGIHVRKLPDVIANPAALAALTDHGFAAAQKVLGEADATTDSKLFRMMVDMTEALNKAQMNDIQRVRRPSESNARQVVENLDKALEQFLELCGLSGGRRR